MATFPAIIYRCWSKSGTDAFIATDKGEKSHKTPLDDSDRNLVKADFEYQEADNTFTCPEGQVLKMIRESQDGKRVYQGSSQVCAEPIARYTAVAANPQKAKPARSVPMTKNPCVNS